MTEAIVLGVIQGLTEYFPVSSTAHLIIFTWLFNSSGVVDTLSFDVALHIGTLCAVIVYFREDWINMFREDRRLLTLIVLATIPAGIAGYLLDDIVESTFRDPLLIAGALILFSFVMWQAEKGRKSKAIKELTLSDALFIGLGQVLALIPGVSRSGITISAGMFRSMEREAAARFSFMLSTPIIAGAAFLHMFRILGSGTDYNIKVISAGVLASGIAGFFAIKFLIGFFRKYSLNVFVYYRIGLGLLIIISLWLKG